MHWEMLICIIDEEWLNMSKNGSYSQVKSIESMKNPEIYSQVTSVLVNVMTSKGEILGHHLSALLH